MEHLSREKETTAGLPEIGESVALCCGQRAWRGEEGVTESG